jgi:hypothetical protein
MNTVKRSLEIERRAGKRGLDNRQLVSVQRVLYLPNLGSSRIAARPLTRPDLEFQSPRRGTASTRSGISILQPHGES